MKPIYNKMFFFQIDLYLRPFKYEVWIVILLSLPVVAAAIYVIKKLSPLKDKEVEQFDKILLHVYRALMSKGNRDNRSIHQLTKLEFLV